MIIAFFGIFRRKKPQQPAREPAPPPDIALTRQEYERRITDAQQDGYREGRRHGWLEGWRQYHEEAFNNIAGPHEPPQARYPIPYGASVIDGECSIPAANLYEGCEAPNQAPIWLSMVDVIRELKLPEREVRKLVAHGVIRASQEGRRICYCAADVVAIRALYRAGKEPLDAEERAAYHATLAQLVKAGRLLTDDQAGMAKPRRRREPITVSLRFEIFKRDHYRCQMCGAYASESVTLEVDHKIAVAKGGTNDRSNLWTLCWECNRGKSDSDL
jgi:HNH endonuclease